MSTLIATYRKNSLYSEHHADSQPKFHASLDLSGFGVETEIKNLPVYYRQLSNPVGAIRVAYSTHIAGLPIETGNLSRLEELIDDTLKALIRFQRLPEYVFQVGTSAWPVYHLDEQFLTRYPGGPVFSAASIPELRRWLRDHFLDIGRITDRKDLNLLFFSPYDLKLYAPSFTFRTPKRDTDDIAVFPARDSDGVALIAPLNGITFSAPLEAGLGIVGLQKIVGSHLIRQGHLNSIYDMTIRKLDPALWELFRDYLSPHSSKLTYFRRTDDKLHRYGLDVFSRDGILYTARLNRLDRTTIYAAPTIQALKDKIGEDLVRYGAVNTINDIRAVSATDKPATSLMDTILHKPAFASR